MAIRPLADTPAKPNGTPLNGGISPRTASNYIENLLDDDGRDAGHPDFNTDDNDIPGGETPGDNESQNLDANTGDSSEQEGGDEQQDTDSNTDHDRQAGSDQPDAEPPISNLAELAEALEMPIDDLKGALQHTFKAAGVEHTVTLGELEKGYQLQADYDRSKKALTEQRDAWKAEHNAQLENFQQQSTMMASAMQSAEQAVIAEFNSPAMEALRSSDPAEWAARMREGEIKLNNMRAMRQNAADQYMRTMQDQHQRFLAQEGQKLLDTVDGWGDEKLKDAVDTVKTLGFNDNEVLDIVDSRLIKAALELRTLREENAKYKAQFDKATKSVKQVKAEVPKTVTAGKVRGAASVARTNVAKLKNRLAKTHNVRDAAKLIETLME